MKTVLTSALVLLATPAWSEQESEYARQERKCDAILQRAVVNYDRQPVQRREDIWSLELHKIDQCQLGLDRHASPQEREERKRLREQERDRQAKKCDATVQRAANNARQHTKKREEQELHKIWQCQLGLDRYASPEEREEKRRIREQSAAKAYLQSRSHRDEQAKKRKAK
jgi:hypothetical protein